MEEAEVFVGATGEDEKGKSHSVEWLSFPRGDRSPLGFSLPLGYSQRRLSSFFPAGKKEDREILRNLELS